MLEKNIKDFIDSRLEYSTKGIYKSTKYINTEENLINLMKYLIYCQNKNNIYFGNMKIVIANY